jgi:acyl carrier protein
MKTIDHDVKQIIAKKLIIENLDKITDDSTLKFLGADSLDRMEIMLKLEEKYEINFDNLENLNQEVTVKNLINYIQENHMEKVI